MLTIQEKLAALTEENTVEEIKQLIDSGYRTHIDWRGRRLVAFDNYNEAVEIDTIAKKFLDARAFRSKAELCEKLRAYALWEQLAQLYSENSHQLQSTWLYKFIVPATELRALRREDPKATIEEQYLESKEARLFGFSEKRFNALWPEKNVHVRFSSTEAKKMHIRWIATKEMVEEAALREIV